MAIDEKTIRESLYYRDKDLGEIWREIAGLIDGNPFSERMRFLLENQHLATTPVKNLKDVVSPPNCIGTAFFVAGVSELDYPYHGYDFELNPHMKQEDNSEHDMFRLFNRHLERRIPGAFAFSYCVDADWHAGVYLGVVGEEHVLFAQHGHKGKFGPESLRNYDSPTYYIPRTLRATSREARGRGLSVVSQPKNQLCITSGFNEVARRAIWVEKPARFRNR
jgi:hypothetical protein